MDDKDQVRKLLRCPIRWLGLSSFSDHGGNITYLKQCPCYVMVPQPTLGLGRASERSLTPAVSEERHRGPENLHF